MSTTANSFNTHRPPTRGATESVRTPYLAAYFVAVIGAFLASAVLGSHDLGVHGPWFFVALLAVGCALWRAGVTPTVATTSAAAAPSEPGDVPVRLVLVKDLDS